MNLIDKIGSYSALFLLLVVYSVSAATVDAQTVTLTRIDGQPDTEGLDPLRQESIRVRKKDNTIVPVFSSDFGMHASLIQVPDWIPADQRPHPSAKYYLYTAGHSGNDIRMAWSDALTGTWQRWNPLGSDDHDGRAWGLNGNHTGAQTPGRGVLDLDIGPQAPLIRLDNGTTDFARGHYIDLGQFELEDHISSPEVIVDDANKRIILWFHAMARTEISPGVYPKGRRHRTFMATSQYGLNFNMPADGGEAGHGVRDFPIGNAYGRFLAIDGEIKGQKVTQIINVGHTGSHYLAPRFTDAGENAGLANADEEGGIFNPGVGFDPKAAADARRDYWTPVSDENGDTVRPHAGALRHPEVKPAGINPNTGAEYDPGSPSRDGARHIDAWYDAAVDRDTIYYFYTSGGDMPESVLMTRVSLAGLTEEQRLDPTNWKRIDEREQLILKPELAWEGALKIPKPSVGGAKSQGNFMRDPHVFYDEDSGKLYLLYNADGESKIGLAELMIVDACATELTE